MLAISSTSCGNNDDNNVDEPETPTTTTINYTGDTVTYPIDDATSTYTSSVGIYRVTLDTETSTATLEIENANFLAGMPTLDVMSFNNITYTTNGSEIQLQSEALTPEIAGRPFPAFPITQLTGTLKPNVALQLSFICTYRSTPYQVTFTGTPSK